MSSSNSSIEWTDATWNPVRGCSRVSPGCDRCYAMLFAHRFAGPGKPYDGLTTIRRGKVDWTGTARLIPSELDRPLRWRKPQRIFVNSMSDLFHHSLSDDAIDRVFGVMWACLYLGRNAVPGHTFQILTKRPERARDYLGVDRRTKWASSAVHAGGGIDPDGIHDQVMFHKGPHPRIWLGTSTENQKTADERIPLLLDCPAALHWVSAEPLIERVDLTPWLHDSNCVEFMQTEPRGFCICSEPREAHIEWVVCGGESGPGARAFDLAWAVDLRKQCEHAQVPFFFKQAGAKPESSITLQRLKLKHRKGADLSELPEGLRVRQFPGVVR